MLLLSCFLLITSATSLLVLTQREKSGLFWALSALKSGSVRSLGEFVYLDLLDFIIENVMMVDPKTANVF